ncbi:MAG TPA: oligopeptide/dipeptide ABC transporter ATP-binding protein, partial [Trebonia sp.]|nr:oligopeptide/dipeptide ABC transporter ATP-binding protein [Trebonia sp.]
LALFRKAADDGLGVLLISHDLASVGTVADRVAVLYAGTIVEAGSAGQLLSAPSHPYTQALLRSVPDLDGVPVRATRGAMPLLREPPASCPFAPRCEFADDACSAARPELTTRDDGSQVACFHPVGGQAAEAAARAGTATAETPATAQAPATAGAAMPDERSADTAEPAPEVPVLQVSSADVVYRGRFGSGGHRALHDVSLSVAHGESVGIVGESGCGKTTLARVIAGLQPVASGSVQLDGADLTAVPRDARRQMYRRVQMVFQDPHGALSPRRSVLDAVTEPLRAQRLGKDEMRARAEQALAQTGLDGSVLDRRPGQLSGGQAQRVGIARALIVDPELVVLDEPTSALDVTVQAQMLELIKGLAAQRARSFVFISHDLATVRGFCDRVVVLYLGRVVEEGPTAQVFDAPLHPYTRALLASAPRLRGDAGGRGAGLSHDIDQAEATSGCPLIPRCPHAVAACGQPQELRAYAPGRMAACHRVPEIVTMTQPAVPGLAASPGGLPGNQHGNQ